MQWAGERGGRTKSDRQEIHFFAAEEIASSTWPEQDGSTRVLRKADWSFLYT